MKRHLLYLSLCLSLIGCGGSSGTPTEPKPPVTPEPPVTELPGQPEDGLPALNNEQPDDFEYNSGGDVTVQVFNEDAFSQSAPAIRSEFELDAVFKSGDHYFVVCIKGKDHFLIIQLVRVVILKTVVGKYQYHQIGQ